MLVREMVAVEGIEIVLDHRLRDGPLGFLLL